MILGSHLEHEGKERDAQTCAEAAAWIIFYLDKMNALPEMQPVTSTAQTTVTPLFNSILKQQ
jgi:hypothetical protein